MSDVSERAEDQGVEDLRMVLYFWEHKQDPTRYTRWEETIKRFPYVGSSWELHELAIKEADARFVAAVDMEKARAEAK
jgi:transposase-like protein